MDDILELDQAIVPLWRSVVFRFVGLFCVVVMLLVALSVVWLDQRARREVEEKFGLALRSVAATAAPSLDGDLLDAVDDDDDVTGAAFRTLREQLATVRRVNGLDEDEVYILRPDGDAWSFVVMLQEATYVGDRYEPPPEVHALYLEVMQSQRASHTRLFEDVNGSFISGLGPIVGSDGRTRGILHVDRGLDAYLAEAGEESRLLLALGVGLVSAIGIAGLWTQARLRRKVSALLEGTRAIRIEDYDHRIEVEGTDELATVATALNDVIRRLKERFEMLKFLPRHTAAMIRSAAEQGVALDHARRVRVVVLESDIRGFSSISEKLPPEVTIGMLNQYIRAQAELVDAAGGSIDKFMGDAVLAVFEGPAMEERALRCALGIQEAIRAMNQAGAFEQPIRVGIGLSVGEVVMGNMGSERRMEHTVIGATVNLAARLCAAAGPDQVVAVEALWEAAGRPGPTPSHEAIEAKGFTDPVPVVRLG